MALQRAFRNVLDNAVKYTPSGGQVRVRASVVSQHAFVVISDTGAGMSPEEQKLAFTPAWRSPAAVAAGIPGRGIGLGVTKELLDQNGGKISLLSEPGHGLEVTIMFPLSREARAPDAARLRPRRRPRDGRGRHGGPRPRRIRGGRRERRRRGAPDRCSGRRPDLVVLDVNMPGLTGWEICDILRRQPVTATLPVLFLTGRGEVADRITAMQVGGTDHLTKPFRAEDLRARARALTGRAAAKGVR